MHYIINDETISTKVCELKLSLIQFLPYLILAKERQRDPSK